MKQTTSNILLVRPANFGFNVQTASSNTFQNELSDSADSLSAIVLNEFDEFIKKLNDYGIKALVVDDTLLPQKPDAIFPNNWISMHEDGKIIMYPMCAPNRRLERRQEIVDMIRESFVVNEVIDLSVMEKENRFLEGTGSIIFDHINKKAYACISPRTDKNLFKEVCDRLNYAPVIFHSYDENGVLVYHTNVMMCIGKGFAVICLETINDESERKLVVNSLEMDGHEIIDISISQMKNFAGNMLALENNKGQNLLAMSESAFNSLMIHQKQTLEKYAYLLPLPITTIETIGGGSARCMIAEIFLSKKQV